ncbi:hypothetical protein FA95DRAFT_921096 [Auriscalpium vulgare]|uniref:Uncharacterized protein n=1 Tax=Auriscalpium vulgare TaxID=40419 RepID=A0ACB8RYI8_9AGAM|nr:hypothetical protein FA95DRAFT_921096 [Auriscalpium vulgare]
MHHSNEPPKQKYRGYEEAALRRMRRTKIYKKETSKPTTTHPLSSFPPTTGVVLSELLLPVIASVRGAPVCRRHTVRVGRRRVRGGRHHVGVGRRRVSVVGRRWVLVGRRRVDAVVVVRGGLPGVGVAVRGIGTGVVVTRRRVCGILRRGSVRDARDALRARRCVVPSCRRSLPRPSRRASRAVGAITARARRRRLFPRRCSLHRPSRRATRAAGAIAARARRRRLFLLLAGACVRGGCVNVRELHALRQPGLTGARGGACVLLPAAARAGAGGSGPGRWVVGDRGRA